jgi:hypothetical protein
MLVCRRCMWQAAQGPRVQSRKTMGRPVVMSLVDVKVGGISGVC